jgi:hypothetical protein
MKKIVFAFSVVFSTLLIGCGGGGDGGDGDSYGSLAVNSVTKAAGISAQWESQAKANNTALSQCGAGCAVVMEFGNGQCAALARGSNMAMGWSTGSSKADASQKAVSQCQTYSGIGCVVLLAECN